MCSNPLFSTVSGTAGFSAAAGNPTSGFTRSEPEKVRIFHRTLEEYDETPLVSLYGCSRILGVRGIYVKDESRRFGLNAFKVLGSSYAIGSMTDALPENPVFITATDGNHGRGVAWAAARLGCKSVVYMPAGTAMERLDNILALGSDASITDLSYDDAVRKAKADAEKNGWVLVQDTSWPGYEEIPRLIMQGYMTMALEAVEQLGGVVPTHVFLQAGVGSMAGAAAAFLADYYGERKPVITIVEPHSADCIFRTAAAGDGKLHFAEGEMHTIMAGLACGEPCGLGWELMSKYAEFFSTISDGVATEGMRLLHRCGITSGESGASAFGLASALLRNPEYSAVKEAIGLNPESVILCFSTEGATDRVNYDRIVGNS